MTNDVDLLISLSKEYTRLLENRKKYSDKYDSRRVSDARLKRTSLLLRQTMLDYEKGRMRND